MYYMEWINENEEHPFYEQINWVSNLTNTTKAQEIFDIWYKEMIGEE